jgi:hypothetical protein
MSTSWGFLAQDELTTMMGRREVGVGKGGTYAEGIRRSYPAGGHTRQHRSGVRSVEPVSARTCQLGAPVRTNLATRVLGDLQCEYLVNLRAFCGREPPVMSRNACARIL